MLAQMQEQFREWLVNASDDDHLRNGLNSSLGLATYQNNYRTQLVNVLRASYPQVLLRMGDGAFLQAAIHHIDHHLPSSWTLDAYGADFGDSLLALYPRNPDLVELAWIEWSLSEAFVAPDTDGVSLDELAGIDWDTARLILTPSLRHLDATTNVTAVWSALQDGLEPPEAEMLESPAGVIVWRRDFHSRLKQMDAIERDALLSLHRDAHFTALCDTLVEQLGDDAGAAKAGALLVEWLQLGIVTGISS